MAIALFSFFRSLFAARAPRAADRPPIMQAPQCAQARAAGVKKPVRVVRTQGRMVISGRLADVCAELDRLVALEAAQALAPAR